MKFTHGGNAIEVKEGDPVMIFRERGRATLYVNDVRMGVWEERETMCTSARETRLKDLEATQEEVRQEIYALKAQIHQEKLDQEIERYVGVQFAGTMRVYTYELKPGHPVNIGDYVVVWSPMTQQNELVRVARRGRGNWTQGTKIAHRIEITFID